MIITKKETLQMTDRLIKLYELNEQYHDTKEKRAWLATTFYAAFCSAVIKWATTIENVETLQKYGWPILVLSVVIFLCVFFFNWFQYRKKRASVKIEGFIAEELSVQNESDNNQLARLFDYKTEVHKRRCKRSDNEKKEEGYSTEIPIFVLMVAFFSAQISVILTTSGIWSCIVKWFAG